jgi:hypothetical protein
MLEFRRNQGLFTTYTTPGPQGVCIDETDDCIWVSEHRWGGSGETIIKIDPFTGEVLRSFPSPVLWSEGLAYKDGSLYVLGLLGSELIFAVMDVLSETCPPPVTRIIRTERYRASNGLTFYNDKLVFTHNGRWLYFMDLETCEVDSVSSPEMIKCVGYLGDGTFISTNARSSEMVLLTLVESGINEEFEEDFHAELYPNPANSSISIVSANDYDIEISITDIAGRMFYKNCFKNIVNIDLADFYSGLYLVSMRSSYGNNIKNCKLCVVK